MAAAKYVWDPFKFYAGYAHIRQTNPSEPLGVGATAQGGYLLSGVEDNNLDSPKIVQVAWTGVKYALPQSDRFYGLLLPRMAERLSHPVHLLGDRRVSLFMLGLPQRGVVLHGSPLHHAFRRLCGHHVFERRRRLGHRHPAQTRRALLLRQQSRTDGGRPPHFLIY